MSDQWAEDERATRTATAALPAGYCILWDRDEVGRFCGTLYGPTGAILCGLAGNRDRVLRVLSESATEFADDPCVDPTAIRSSPSDDGRAGGR